MHRLLSYDATYPFLSINFIPSFVLIHIIINVNAYVLILYMLGHGQKGLIYSEGITWTRDCSVSDYCFQATTTDIKKVQKLIDYTWVIIIYIS